MPSVTAKLEPQELVSFYMDRNFRSYMDAALTSAKIVPRGSDTVYAIEWTYRSVGKTPYTQIDEFVFHGTTVYHIQGVYPSFDTEARNTIIKTVQSPRLR